MGGIDSYTKLMLHGDGDNNSVLIKDSSFLPYAITVAGNAKISTAQSKFGGSSILLDGNADWLYLADSADWLFSTDFTVDFWINFNALPGNGVSLFIMDQYISGSQRWFLVIANSAGVYSLRYGNQGATGGDIDFSRTVAIATGAWHHVALVRYGNIYSLYYDGALLGATYTSTSIPLDLAAGLYIGDYAGSGSGVNCYIDELRISKGVARWMANFTPPAFAYSVDTPIQRVDSFTKLLLHGNGADGSKAIYDSSSTPKVITVSGHTQIDTAQSVFGDGSILFDGTDDYLSVADSDDWFFDTGAFTIDFWFRIAALPVAGAAGRFCFFSQYADANNRSYLSLLHNPEGSVSISHYAVNGGVALGVWPSVISAISINTWYHVALVGIAGGNQLLFLNGALINFITPAAAMPNVAAAFEIGRYNVTGSPVYYLNGWLDEFRVSKGVARWTADFVPPRREYDIFSRSGYLKKAERDRLDMRPISGRYFY